MAEYANILGRAKTLQKNIEALIKRNSELEEANRKLRANEETYLLREQARERVLASSN